MNYEKIFKVASTIKGNYWDVIVYAGKPKDIEMLWHIQENAWHKEGEVIKYPLGGPPILVSERNTYNRAKTLADRAEYEISDWNKYASPKDKVDMSVEVINSIERG